MSPGSDKAAARDALNFSPESWDGAPGGGTLQARISAALSGRFEIISEIDRGGSAVIFLARDLNANRQVAIKLLRPELSAAFDAVRFQREIDIGGRLQHPNILPVLDSGHVDGSLFFTMPFVGGDTLRARIRKQSQLPLSDAIRIARDVANALDYAHGAGVIHRDIKPANILLDGDATLVADFGIARAMTVATGERVTESGVTVGTPEYMSPEQGLGQKNLEASSDIYALGCVMYEMLAGEAPFTGPTAQAIVARHCREAPRSLRIVRPAIPYGVERAIEKALAKNPVDRFQTAGAFVDAIERGMTIEHEPPRWRAIWTKPRMALGVAAILAASTAIAAALAATRPELQANQVVVFPPYDAGAPAGSSDAEGVATYIGNALSNAPPLTWVDGWEVLPPEQRTERLSTRDARKLASSKGARYYISGVILRDRDSVRVMLTLHDAAQDSVIGSGRAAAASASAVLPVLGVRAASQLLPVIVRPGGQLNIATLMDRSPRAIANFLQGEREYRRMQFVPALRHYEQALAEDSALTLAAVRAAYAANWSRQPEAALRHASFAISHVADLSPAQGAVARGLRFMLQANADSAIAHLQKAIRLDPGVHGAHTLLGETYLRYLPSAGPTDSLGRAALELARQTDPDFGPTLLLLETIALNTGNVRDAARLGEELRRAGADTSHRLSRNLAIRCVRDGPESIDFHAALRIEKQSVLAAAKMLDGTARQPRCAIAAYTAVLEAADANPGERWAAFLGLQAQFAATDHPAQARAVFNWPGVQQMQLRPAYLIVGEAGVDVGPMAQAAAESTFRKGYARTASSSLLWVTGNWEMRQKNDERVRAIAARLARMADSTKSRLSTLAAQAMAARVRLLDRDTSGAIAALRALVPTAKQGDLSWVPSEGLGSERILLAELLLARKSYLGARRVAGLLDSPEPVIYPLYLRRSLEIRVRAAEADGQPALAAAYRRRLTELSESLKAR